MAWKTSNRRKRLPSGWAKLALQVLRRDRTCQIKLPGCLGTASEVDHKVAGDNHLLSNLQGACTKCHATKSAGEGNASKARKRALGQRPPMRHPLRDP